MLLDRIAALSVPKDADEFCAALIRAARDMEFGRVSAMLATEVPGSRSAFACIGNTPDAFANEHNDPKLGRRDPVMQHARRHVTPLIYDQGTYIAAGAGELWETQAKYGYQTGVVATIRLGSCQCLALGVDRDERISKRGEVRARLCSELMMMAAYASPAAQRLLAPETQRMGSVYLTSRERDVLSWTALGKSSWAIGTLTGLSPSTVNFHLRNAMRKFGVSSRHVAASHALRLGLIAP